MLERLLKRLQQECHRSPSSSMDVLRSLEALLVWLVAPENNTDSNCRSIDVFVCTQIRLTDDMPEQLKAIIEDVGGILHDTHTARDVALNFESTPEQLLARTRALMQQLGHRPTESGMK